MAILLEGKKFKKELLEELKEKRKKVKNIKLVNIYVEKRADLEIYIKEQKKLSQILEVDFIEMNLKREEEIIQKIKVLNSDPQITGIFIQHPLPKEFNYFKIIEVISPLKDVEGITPQNLGQIFLGKPFLIPPPAFAAYFLIKSTKVDLKGKQAVIIGHSEIIGKPLAHLLLNELCTVSICHIATFNSGKLFDYTKVADILCVGVGKPSLIKASHIKEGSIIIDLGVNKVQDKIIGDVEFESVIKKASFLTPVPGGVGPLTSVFLFKNLFKLAELNGV